MSGEGTDLTPIQERILLMLLEGGKVSEIIAELNIAKGTYYKLTRQEEFKREFRQRKAENFEAAFTRMQSSLITDVRVLEEIRDDPKSNRAARLKAVRLLLEYSVNAHDREQLEQRIAQLEEKLGLNPQFRT